MTEQKPKFSFKHFYESAWDVYDSSDTFIGNVKIVDNMIEEFSFLGSRLKDQTDGFQLTLELAEIWRSQVK